MIHIWLVNPCVIINCAYKGISSIQTHISVSEKEVLVVTNPQEAWPSDWDVDNNQGAWFMSPHRFNILEYDELDC